MNYTKVLSKTTHCLEGYRLNPRRVQESNSNVISTFSLQRKYLWSCALDEMKGSLPETAGVVQSGLSRQASCRYRGHYLHPSALRSPS